MNRRTVSYLSACAAAVAAAGTVLLTAGSGGAAVAAPMPDSPVCIDINVLDTISTDQLCPGGGK